jgi:hypothetical protein
MYRIVLSLKSQVKTIRGDETRLLAKTMYLHRLGLSLLIVVSCHLEIALFSGVWVWVPLCRLFTRTHSYVGIASRIQKNSV